jgi:isopenicillin N synthase-like dioxygenase
MNERLLGKAALEGGGMDIPVIDIAGFDENPAARQRIVAAWAVAFESLGFAQIIGHGVDPALIAELDRESRGFFALPLAEKLKSRPPLGGGIGYAPVAAETLGRTMSKDARPDLVESMMFNDLLWDPSGRAAQFTGPGAAGEIWPAALPGFRTSVERYVRATYDLGQRLMRISALALNLPEDHFAPFFRRMAHALRLAWYPEQPAPPLPGQLRSGPHTDFSGFTILHQDSAPGGLQVLGPDGSWIDAPPLPGAFVINAGDLLQRWTNDRWRSNIHRVVNPPREVADAAARLSIVLFTGPDQSAAIECLPGCVALGEAPRYAPIVAAEHSAMKLREALGG